MSALMFDTDAFLAAAPVIPPGIEPDKVLLVGEPRGQLSAASAFLHARAAAMLGCGFQIIVFDEIAQVERAARDRFVNDMLRGDQRMGDVFTYSCRGVGKSVLARAVAAANAAIKVQGAGSTPMAYSEWEKAQKKLDGPRGRNRGGYGARYRQYLQQYYLSNGGV
jgi:hypothetical protein